MKHLYISITLLLILSMLSSCSTPPAMTGNKLETDQDSRPRVVASFHAMEQLVYGVGQDLIDISTIVPDGANAHSFEPKAQDMLKLADADLFVINGLGMEAWADDAVEAATNDNLTVLDTSINVDRIMLSELDEKYAAEKHSPEDSDHGHEHAEFDPHTWLGLTTAMTQVESIRDALVELDPENETAYTENADAFLVELNTLYTTYKSKFDALENKTFVTGHAAFAYLCRDFDLVQNSVQSVFAEGEPSAKQLAELIDYSREHKVTTIFTEHLTSPNVSRTLANEVGASVETIYTISSAEDGKTFLERVSDNLAKILIALQE